MTTSHSPISKIKAQADKIARVLAMMERGEPVPAALDPGGKVAAARGRDAITVGIVMDDKLIKVTITWATIKECGEVGLSAWIVRQMRDERDKGH